MNNKDIRTIMVTGAGGFLGGELLNKLYNNTNYNIVGITSKKEDIYRKYKNQNILVCYNIEGWEKEKIPWNSIDLIVHCAFSRSYDGFFFSKSN
ncbi:MAG: NAD-dependent epimerase/dehydratase family protein [Dethiobacteria bacterium]